MKLFGIVQMSMVLGCLGAVQAAEKSQGKPNILLILADDLGYADLGCQGSPDVKTPNIDSLAANGVRCTAGYVTAPQCSPSRAGLLSGRHQQRFGQNNNAQFPLMLMNGGKTIADHLKPAGYATAHFGKWHLGFSGNNPNPEGSGADASQTRPVQHGFDVSFGFDEYRAEKKTTSSHAFDDRVFAEKAVDFITQHCEDPWFVYLAFHAPHTQQVDFGGYRDRFPDADEKRAKVLSVMAQQDDAVGMVLAKLCELKLEEDTLIFYISDNGGTQRSEGERKHFTGSLNTPFRGDKGTAFEGGIRVPFLVQWKGRLPAEKTYDHAVSSLDVLPTVLAGVQIAPLPGVDLEGVNILPFLDGQNPADPHEALFWRWGPEQAIRSGNWKLVRGREIRQWRLIDLSSDLKEEKDLSSQYPEKAKELLSRFEQWAAALPPVGPSFKDAEEGGDDSDDNQGKKKKK